MLLLVFAHLHFDQANGSGPFNGSVRRLRAAILNATSEWPVCACHQPSERPHASWPTQHLAFVNSDSCLGPSRSRARGPTTYCGCAAHAASRGEEACVALKAPQSELVGASPMKPIFQFC